MEDTELTELLKTFDDKLAQANSLNLKLAEEVEVQKSVSVLKDLNSYRVVELVIGIIVAMFLGSFLYDNRESRSLVMSAGILLFFTFVSIFGCIRQLILLSKFDCSQSVTQNQATLISLQTHHINYFRLTILQFPFYLAYILVGFKIFFNVEIWQTGNRNWLISNLLISLVLVPISIWLFRKLQLVNLHVKWVRAVFEFSGGQQVSKAIEFLDQIQKFKHQ